MILEIFAGCIVFFGKVCYNKKRIIYKLFLIKTKEKDKILVVFRERNYVQSA